MISVVTLKVDGKSINSKSFVVQDMNLSSAKNGMTKHEFNFQISSHHLISLMSIEYNEWIVESAKDDAIFGSPQDELAEAGYPELSALLTMPRLVKIVFGGYLLRELFAKCTWDGVSDIQYWYDETVSCNVRGELIEINGICYSRPET